MDIDYSQLKYENNDKTPKPGDLCFYRDSSLGAVLFTLVKCTGICIRSPMGTFPYNEIEALIHRYDHRSYMQIAHVYWNINRNSNDKSARIYLYSEDYEDITGEWK